MKKLFDFKNVITLYNDKNLFKLQRVTSYSRKYIFSLLEREFFIHILIMNFTWTEFSTVTTINSNELTFSPRLVNINEIIYCEKKYY